jgi:hypothetical protein
MNVANLQLEGLLVVLSEFARLFADGDPTRRSQLQEALKRAEAVITADGQRLAQLSASQRESLLFPARYLACATQPGAEGAPFSQLAAQVGENKAPRTF